MQFPGLEERTPVDGFGDLAQVVVLEHAPADELGLRQVGRGPVDRDLVLPCGVERHQRRGLLVRMLLAQLRVVGLDLREVAAPCRSSVSRLCATRTERARIRHVDDRTFVVAARSSPPCARATSWRRRSAAGSSACGNGRRAASPCATYAISSRLGVIRPDRPMMSAPSAFAFARISEHGTITPMLTTSKLLHWSTTVTMFLPMSWTSPLTVAMTILPFGLRLAAGRDERRLLGLDERNQMRHRLLHHARALDHLRQEHLAGAEEVADDVHAVHQRPFDDLDRTAAGRVDLGAHLFGVLDDPLRDAVDQRVRQARLDRLGAPLEVGFLLLAARLQGRRRSRPSVRSRRAGDSARRPRPSRAVRARGRRTRRACRR